MRFAIIIVPIQRIFHDDMNNVFINTDEGGSASVENS